MARNDVVVYQGDGLWRLRYEGGCAWAASYATRDAAVETGRAEARRRGVGLVVRGPDGGVEWREEPDHAPRWVRS